MMNHSFFHFYANAASVRCYKPEPPRMSTGVDGAVHVSTLQGLVQSFQRSLRASEHHDILSIDTLAQLWHLSTE
jgi:hypothetical protein